MIRIFRPLINEKNAKRIWNYLNSMYSIILNLRPLYGPIKRSSMIDLSSVNTSFVGSDDGSGGDWIDIVGTDCADLDSETGDKSGDCEVDTTGTYDVVGDLVGNTNFGVVDTGNFGRTRFKIEELGGIVGNGFGFFANTFVLATKMANTIISILIEAIFKMLNIIMNFNPMNVQSFYTVNLKNFW